MAKLRPEYGRFLGDVLTLWQPNGRYMRLETSVMFLDRRGATWTAQRGFVFDGASIPRFFWRAIGSPFTGPYRRAAIIHDYLYEHEPHVLRSDADRLFREAALADGAGYVLAWVMWLAVRCFGGWSWRRYRRGIRKRWA